MESKQTMAQQTQQFGFLTAGEPPVGERQRRHFISAALQLPVHAIAYEVSVRLSELYPEKALLHGSEWTFDLEGYARAGHCAIAAYAVPYGHYAVEWDDVDNVLDECVMHAWLDVTWQDGRLEVLLLTLENERLYFILAADKALAERFCAAIYRWQGEAHGEVLVFERGRWEKSERLYDAIKSADVAGLVLRGSLKEDILADVTRFFAARETYARYGVAWKRGILFAGPPGNGKTHAVKALVNAVGRPCLYVKSFRGKEGPDEFGMRSVFAQARASAPCILVLEDLDALVTDENRSFFLNEMDGFAANGGVLTLATTNHPERLDAAIADRPSRFDRTYRFDLPTVLEREVYIARWNASLEPAMHLSMAAVARAAEGTEGFSFAYLKELFLSATIRWLDDPCAGVMEEIASAQIDLLRAQMRAIPVTQAEGGAGRD